MYMRIYVFMCVCVHMYVYVQSAYVCECKCMYAGLDIGGNASANASHFCGNYESLWQNDSSNFFGTANQFWPIVNHFSNRFTRLFLFRTPFLDKISPLLGKFM